MRWPGAEAPSAAQPARRHAACNLLPPLLVAARGVPLCRSLVRRLAAHAQDVSRTKIRDNRDAMQPDSKKQGVLREIESSGFPLEIATYRDLREAGWLV